jgi:hypothetical protein
MKNKRKLKCNFNREIKEKKIFEDEDEKEEEDEEEKSILVYEYLCRCFFKYKFIVSLFSLFLYFNSYLNACTKNIY